MKVRVRLFAVAAQRAGESELELTLPEGATAGDVVAALAARHGRALPAGTAVAVNQEYAGPGHGLREGDEVAIIPPVSGG
jgi:molybdopterin converting factor subunit 1